MAGNRKSDDAFLTAIIAIFLAAVVGLIALIAQFAVFMFKLISERRRLKKASQSPDNLANHGDASYAVAEPHLGWARNSVACGDYLRARMEYLKCVESLKHADCDQDTRDLVQLEYDNFVKIDPIFQKLMAFLGPFIVENPGVLQSVITKKYESKDWPELYSYTRSIAKEDVYYALYFAAKFGMIERKKKGRSYELRIPKAEVVTEDVPAIAAAPALDEAAR